MIPSSGTASWAFIAMSWYSSFLASSESASHIFLPGKDNFPEQNWWNGGTWWLLSDGKCQLMHPGCCHCPLLFTPNQKQTVLWNIEDLWNKKTPSFTTHTALLAVPDLPPPDIPNATFTPEKLSLEGVWLFHLVWCFWDSRDASALFTRDSLGPFGVKVRSASWRECNSVLG